MGERLEALGVALVYALFALLPLNAASALGGRIGAALGPRFGRSRVARRNLRHAFPTMSEGEIEAAVQGMWENIGRGFAEYPHLSTIAPNRPIESWPLVTVEGAEHARALAQDGAPGVVVSGHIGNWEIMPLVLRALGLPIAVVYRAPNNRLVDRLLHRARRNGAISLIAKGSEGARSILNAMREGVHVGMLIDQKSSDGLAIPVFGRPAMTSAVPAQLALRFGCPILPIFVRRTKGARFHVTLLPPFTLEKSGDKTADLTAGLVRINALLEAQIRLDPAQWLWLHRRWPEG